MTDKEPLITMQRLSVGYGRKPLLQNIDWEVKPGSLWGIIGRNGAGKTTLLRTVLGLIRPLAGSMDKKQGLRCGYVKQRHELHEIYPFSIGEVVMTGRYGLMSSLSKPGVEDYQAVEEALASTGIDQLRDTPVRELSGGQRQRVLIARALAARPDVIILDEPTNDMDMAGEESVLRLIMNIHRQTGSAVIIVSHLLHAVLRIADDIMLIGESSHSISSKEDFIREKHLERYYDMPVKVIDHRNGYYSVLPGREGVS